MGKAIFPIHFDISIAIKHRLIISMIKKPVFSHSSKFLYRHNRKNHWKKTYTSKGSVINIIINPAIVVNPQNNIFFFSFRFV